MQIKIRRSQNLTTAFFMMFERPTARQRLETAYARLIYLHLPSEPGIHFISQDAANVNGIAQVRDPPRLCVWIVKRQGVFLTLAAPSLI